jgi:hypothetical protein
MSITHLDPATTAEGLSEDMVRAAAEANGVCTNPLVRIVMDNKTGRQFTIPIPCGSTRENRCVPCATKARRLRMHQAREGWHLTTEPPARRRAPAPDWDDIAGWLDDGGALLPQEEDRPMRRPVKDRVVRSTTRLAGFPDLPKAPMGNGTVGRVYVDRKTGREHRPSMFVTLTLPGYGAIKNYQRPDGKWASSGVPVDPDTYDYRRAALDALTFSRLVDRWWQNLRRCAGYKVQYFATVEAQKRLAPHLHAAVRGSVPRATLKAVAAATYYAAWWPPCDDAHAVYQTDGLTWDADIEQWLDAATGEVALLPSWDPDERAYLDPVTGRPLPTWEQATTDLEKPAHVVTLGEQIDAKGLIGGTADSERSVRYLCKYLTKSIAGTYSETDSDGTPANELDGDDEYTAELLARHRAYERHIDRLHARVKVLPCGPECANWLRYGVQPKNAGPGLFPGRCESPAHDRENLGLGGRRVLVSRQWSGKTLTMHRADRSAVVREVLREAGFNPEDADRLSAARRLPDGSDRYTWREPQGRMFTYADVIASSLAQRIRWKADYQAAKQQLGLDPPRDPGPVDNRSAIATVAA